jgi:FSR family fosmidomycin resistance protein-like MFS transporter
MQYRSVVLLSLGHLATDLNQGALPVLLPFLISEHHLSYAAAAGIVLAVTITSSVVQPFFGYFADRVSSPWIMPAGLVVSGAGIALVGIVPSYGWILLVVAVSGIGVAAYHPEGARLVSCVARQDQATAMSYFGIGGSLGFVMGPAIATAVLLTWGLRATVLLVAPVLVMAAILAPQLSALSAYEGASRGTKEGTAAGEAWDAWGPFGRLSLVVIGRSIVFYALNTFVPLYWIHVLHQSQARGGAALSIMSAAGILGNVFGGKLADRFGYRRVVLGGSCLSIPLLPALLWADRAEIALGLLILVGFVFSSTYSPTVVMGQRYLPNRVGLASGVTLGLAVAVGGIASPFLGWIADHHGIRAALAGTIVLPVVNAALAFTLPDPGSVIHRRRR